MKGADDMKKAIFIMILAAMLTGCANSAEGEKTETSVFPQAEKPVSLTSTAVNLSPETEERSETFTETTVVETSEITKETTSLITEKTPETTTKMTTEVMQETVPQTVTKRQTETQTYYEPTRTQTKTQTTTAKRKTQTTTAAATKPPETSAKKPQTEEAENTVEWSENMKIWRKLCECKQLSEKEQNVIRNEIYEYAQNFNGRTEIQVNFGKDSYNISYEKPLKLTPDNSMTDISNAHMDSYCDADSRWEMEYANSEQEIYEIVCETRRNCLQIVDHGLYNRWEIYSQNGALKYASEVTFGIGFDGTCVWFLTED